MSGPFSLGIDYGTLSVRTVVVDMTDGREVSSAVYEYPHGVMDRVLPDGTPLPDGFALAHPQDYLDGLTDTVRRALAASGVKRRGNHRHRGGRHLRFPHPTGRKPCSPVPGSAVRRPSSQLPQAVEASRGWNLRPRCCGRPLWSGE